MGGDEVFGSFGSGGVCCFCCCERNELKDGRETYMGGEDGGQEEDSKGLVEGDVKG